MATFAPAGLTLATRLGFDDSVMPPWVMVPMGGNKLVSLRGGEGLSIRTRGADPRGPGVVTYNEQPFLNDRGIMLKGVSTGTVLMEAVDGSGRVKATLEITVKAKLTLSTSVHFVSDKSGRGPRISTRTADAMINSANAIYLPQANIELKSMDFEGIRLPFDLEQGVPGPFEGDFGAKRSWFQHMRGPLPCISTRKASPVYCPLEETQLPDLTEAEFEALRQFQIKCNIFTNVSPTSDYNIFFVERIRQKDMRFFVQAYSPRNMKHVAINACVIPGVLAFGFILAHEFGHYLLAPEPPFLQLDATGHSTGVNDLMQNGGPSEAIKIPKVQANFMNVSGFD